MTKESQDLQVTNLHLKDWRGMVPLFLKFDQICSYFGKHNLDGGYQSTHVRRVRPATSSSVGSLGPNN